MSFPRQPEETPSCPRNHPQLSKCSLLCCRLRRVRLINANNAVTGDIGQCLMNAAWPSDLNIARHRVRSEPEMGSLVIGREIAPGGRDRPVLRPMRGCQLDLSANRITIALVSHQKQR